MNRNVLDSLIERAQKLEPEAFDALVDQFGPRLFGYLCRLTGSREDADDLLQELFVRLVRMLPRYNHDGRFEAWIFRIATNLARDRIRRAQRTPTIVSIDADDSDGNETSAMELADLSHPPPDAPMQLREEVDALQQALARLPTAEREVVMLRHFSGMSFAEIAQAMDTPIGTALARAHRGLNKLRELMGEDNKATSLRRRTS